MILNPKRIPILFVPWALAVAMMCIGSLINFHQHRIWHQPLLPTIIAHKKDVELTQTQLVLAKLSMDRQHPVGHDFLFAVDPEISRGVELSGFTFTAWISHGDRIPEYLLSSSPGLRAPPLA
jgi:hypothetical protein